MINLEHMDLSHNLLSELPLSINELRKLETLDVRNCHLRYLPYTMNDLRNTLREVIRLCGTYPLLLDCPPTAYWEKLCDLPAASFLCFRPPLALPCASRPPPAKQMLGRSL
jgi:hypothetical protein